MSKKQQASSSKLETRIRILHEEWALKQGLRPKHQAASIKRQAASVDARLSGPGTNQFNITIFYADD